MKELTVSVMQDQSLPAEIEGSTTDIHLPEGFELADYTLRRVHDGQLQTYVLDNDHSRLVQAVPISAQPSVTQMEGDDQIDQSDPGSDSSTPVPATNNSSHQTQPPHQQLFTIPIPSARPSNRAKAPSSCTQKRHAFSRNDGYTIICGMNSPAKATPVKKINPGKGKFRCPRCGSNFTRPKSVKDHFPDCVLKCGNPEGLRYTDHPSMAKAEANLQHRGQASHEASDSAMEDEQEEEEKEEEGNDDDEKMEWEDEQMRADDQATRFEEMDDTPYVYSEYRHPHTSTNQYQS